jgi:acyl-CoA reductase-like NAD-dependent aldehyde dehydrogenase
MGYINPLLRLPAGKALQELPKADRERIEAVMRELRDQANQEAETAWRRRKAAMAAYWRAVSTYARHIAHALSSNTREFQRSSRFECSYAVPVAA